MFRYFVFLVTSVAVMTSTQFPIVSNSSAQTADRNFQAQRKILGETIDLIRDLRNQIDRSQFDLSARLDRLDYDFENIIKFVKDDIYFEQYPGVLRGAQGTLIARAGNSLDQALLLATLLRDAGYEARIARAKLTKEDASLMLAEMQKPRKPSPPIFDHPNEAESILRRLAVHSAITDKQIDALFSESAPSSSDETGTLAEDARAEAKFILGVLERNDIEIRPLPINNRISYEMTDYFFVELREQARSPWMPIHPSLSSGFSFSGPIQATAYYDESIPDELQHRFRFEVLLKWRAANEVNTHSLFGIIERAVSKMIGSPITYTNVSMNLLNNAESNLYKSAADRADLFLPVIDTATQSDAFDLRGNIIPADAALSAYAALFQTISEQLHKATEALSGSGPSRQDADVMSRRLEGVEIKYSLLTPTGQQHDFYRTVFDANEANRASNFYLEAVQQLTRVYSVSVGSGAISPAYALDRSLDELVLRGPELDALLAYLGGELSDSETQDRLRGEVGYHWAGHGLLELLHQSVPWTDENVISYVPEPTIVVHHREMPITRNPIETVDIITRPRKTFVRSTLDPAFEENVFAGVWETYTEGALTNPDGIGRSWGTKAAFDEARKANQKFMVLQPSQIVELAELNIPASVQKYMLRDLNDGYVLILPEPDIKHSDNRAYNWWRIDPEYGNTLGVSGSGEGMDATEYSMLLVFFVGALTLACVAENPRLRRDPNRPRPPEESIRNIKQCTGLSISVTGFISKNPVIALIGILWNANLMATP